MFGVPSTGFTGKHKYNPNQNNDAIHGGSFVHGGKTPGIALLPPSPVAQTEDYPVWKSDHTVMVPSMAALAVWRLSSYPTILPKIARSVREEGGEGACGTNANTVFATPRHAQLTHTPESSPRTS